MVLVLAGSAGLGARALHDADIAGVVARVKPYAKLRPVAAEDLSELARDLQFAVSWCFATNDDNGVGS